MQKLRGIAVSPGVAIGDALVIDNEGFRIPRRFVAATPSTTSSSGCAARSQAAGEEIIHNRDTIGRGAGGEIRGDLRGPSANAPGRPPAERVGGDDPPAALLARSTPSAARCGATPRSSRSCRRATTWRSGPTTSSTSRSGSCGNLLGRRREGLAHLTSPVLVLAHNLTPSETANLDRRFVRGFVTEVGGPGSHTAIVAEALEIPAVVGTGPFPHRRLRRRPGDHRRRQGAGDPPARRGNARPLPPRGRGDPHAGRPAGDAPRPAGGDRPTASAWKSAGQHRVSTTRSTTAWTAGPTASDCTAPSSSTSAREGAGRGSAITRPTPGGQDHGGPPGDHPHLRHGGRQGARTCPRRKTSGTRSWACGASAWPCATCPCSARSCGPILRASAWAT